jgi:hypothetical protein
MGTTPCSPLKELSAVSQGTETLNMKQNILLRTRARAGNFSQKLGACSTPEASRFSRLAEKPGRGGERKSHEVIRVQCGVLNSVSHMCIVMNSEGTANDSINSKYKEESRLRLFLFSSVAAALFFPYRSSWSLFTYLEELVGTKTKSQQAFFGGQCTQH